MASAVLTRDLEGAVAYAEALAPLGLEVVAMPVTHTAPPRDPEALARALERGGYAAIVVASARAAQAIARARAHGSLTALPEVWAVGPATARALIAAGIPALQSEVAHDAMTLAHSLIAQRDLAGRRVLVPRAEDGRDEAIATLRAAGVDVDDVIAYRTIPTPVGDPLIEPGRALLASGGAAVCGVFAPSQVAALAALLGTLGDLETAFVAIGDTTAAALHEHGVTTVGVADRPTPEGLAKAVAAVYGNGT